MSQYFDNDKNIKSERKIIKFNFDNKVFSIIVIMEYFLKIDSIMVQEFYLIVLI